MITDNLVYLVAIGAAPTGSTTLVINVGAGGGCPVLPGERIVVGGGGGTGIPTGVTDTQGNTYTQVQNNATSPAAWQFVAVAGNHGLRTDGQGGAAPGGGPDQITLTYGGTGSPKLAVVFGVSGPMLQCIGAAGAVDTGANATATGTSATPSITSGALAGAPTGELVVATLSNAQAGGVPVWGANWLPLGSAQTGTTAYSSTAVWVPDHPNCANTHGGTGTITATATLSSSQAWTMAITAIRPGPNVVKALVGATVFHGAYPSTPNPSSPPGQGDVNAAFRFDTITGTLGGHNIRKTYFKESMWPTSVTQPRPVGTYSDNGIATYLCLEPQRAVGGGVPAEKTNLTAALVLYKNYLCQKGPNNGGLMVILWQEPNLWGKSGHFGDGSAAPEGLGGTPYWSTGQPPMTEPQAASNYKDYCQYYTPTIFAAGFPVGYDPVVSSPSTGVDFCPGRAYMSAYLWDYYFHADYAAGAPTLGVGKGCDQTQFIAQAQAMTPLPAIGVAELGTNDSHAPHNTPADIWYAGYQGWMHNVVVGPILAYIAAGGYLAPSAWYEESQGVGCIDPNPPVSTPQTILDNWSYFYAQLSPAASGAPVVATASPLPGATVGQPYNTSVAASGGTPPYTWAITSGQLPPGIKLSAAGQLTGTCNGPYTRTPTFTVTDSLGATGSAVLSITVAANVLAMATTKLPGATVGQPYATTVNATGGVAPYTWAITSGALPAGLALASSNTTSVGISGTPTGGAGTFPVSVQVTDNVGATATLAASIKVVVPALTVATTQLPAATPGVAYFTSLTAIGGTAPYSWAVTAGVPPPGIAVSADGSVAGIAVTPGASLFTVTVTDSASATASQALTLTVLTAQVIVTPAPWSFLIAAPQPDGTYLAQVAQASALSFTLRSEADQFHEASVTMVGTSDAATAVAEMLTDLHIMYAGQLMFVGRIGPATDTLDAAGGHQLQITANDYREVLRRRAILPGDTLGYTSDDQAHIAWELIQLTQGRSGGNLGIVRGKGQTTGVQRTMTFALGDMIGDDITQMFGLNNGAEWQITPYGPADLRLDVFFPEQGTSRGVVLAPGDGLVSSIQRAVDPSTFANAVYETGVAGSTTAVFQESGTVSEGRWDRATGTNLKTQSALNDAAAADLASGQVLIPAYTVALKQDAWQGPSHIWLGDTVTVQISSGRLQVNDPLRVIEMAFVVTTDGKAQVTLTIGAKPLRLEKKIPVMLRRLRYLETR